MQYSSSANSQPESLNLKHFTWKNYKAQFLVNQILNDKFKNIFQLYKKIKK